MGSSVRAGRLAAALGVAASGCLVCACETSDGADAPAPNPNLAAAGLGFPLDPEPLGPVAFEPMFVGMSFQQAVFCEPVPGRTERWVVLERTGMAWLVAGPRAAPSRTVFLDLRSELASQPPELGLLGLAFDPEFASTGSPHRGAVYVSFTRTDPLRSVLSRFRLDELDQDRLAPAFEEVLLEVEQPFTNHNGGHVEFGPDGMLYWSLGDGGSAGDPFDNAQNLATLAGSILRLDVRSAPDPGLGYAVPDDNPFVASAPIPGARTEIWVYGLRNPWRFAFDPLGEVPVMWIGDVGQSQQEELTYARSGENHGWRVREGDVGFAASSNQPAGAALVDPVFAYGRDQGTTVVAGRTYQGAAIEGLRNHHVFGDYGSGRVWALSSAGGEPVEIASLPGVVSIHTDRDGELIAVAFSGTVHRLVASGPAPGGGSIPATLSATGIFADLATLAPAAGVHAYDVQVPFWSGAVATTKRRFLAVPQPLGQPVRQGGDAYDAAVGTVTVKHFETATGVRLETRVMVSTRGGWRGYAYRWREDGSDADLLTAGGATITTEVGDHVVPDRAQCFECHRPGGGTMLGVGPAQWSVGQRADFVERGLLVAPRAGAPAEEPPIVALGDSSATDERRAHAWLVANCSACHRPDTGIGGFDLRAGTALGDAGIVGIPAQTGSVVGLPDGRLVAPGAPSASVLFLRAGSVESEARMPPFDWTDGQDPLGVELLDRWIREIGGGG